MTRRSAGTGRIRLIKHLLSKLTKGEWVGPATAIGQDYHVLEMKRVVELSPYKGEQYSMRLLKREVGELAYEVTTLGEAAESPLIHSGSVSRYSRPEETRSTARKKQNPESRRQTADILTALRTGRR